VFELGLLGRLGFGPMLESCAVCGGAKFPAAAEVAYRWDPDRGGAVCGACGKRGRPIRAVVRQALVRLAGTAVDAAPLEPLSADVNRGGRDAIFEIIKLHINGPLLSLDFIAKMGGHV
jgi:recombinational DNA repair protein (RecF pathway)